ncbi:Ric8 family guanine nucleotide exchange factor synembryn family protein [Schizosaccharomyces japonicus yFS275]|uniref:Ric8 family guanine nucleotide exchange factor synembryn family protein n=1 Tax=Schizosaccharomyces japonicus (strain yFS275 / FY16936) TaxID=402676 RepID=B6JZI7_SCHJY|nr:Ric8 family guanine nucleotide exchange factor synembryn family protein [Schizosaccharomyces japonicus yFS275]EEB06955.1 Ric8 family guanine nucleotide exchange factor synembryn family protein [Schizosaccharomyces japonicus yFS275]
MPDSKSTVDLLSFSERDNGSFIPTICSKLNDLLKPTAWELSANLIEIAVSLKFLRKKSREKDACQKISNALCLNSACQIALLRLLFLLCVGENDFDRTWTFRIIEPGLQLALGGTVVLNNLSTEPVSASVLDELLRLAYAVGSSKDLPKSYSTAQLSPFVIQLWKETGTRDPSYTSNTSWHIVNALLVLPLQNLTSSSLYQITDIALTALDVLLPLKGIQLLEAGNASFKVPNFASVFLTAKELEVRLSPLLALLQNIVKVNDTQTCRLLESRLFPSEADRSASLAFGSGLPSRLLRLLVIPCFLQMPQQVAHLYYSLCRENAKVLTDTIGFGYASGILRVCQEPTDSTVSKDSLFSGLSTATADNVNPITGGRTESEKPVPEMSMEEKEREAERLFVLFQRLEKNGMIQVENPVKKAVRSGLFENSNDNNA